MSRTFRETSIKWESSWQPKWKNTSDRKKYYKPSSKFKRLEKAIRKAKERQALKDGKEDVPRFKKTDVWNWL